MNRVIYDASMLVAIALGAVGAGLQWGLPVGMMVGGASIMAATVAGVVLGR